MSSNNLNNNLRDIDSIIKEIDKTTKNLDKVYEPKFIFGMPRGRKGVGLHHLTGPNKKFHHKQWLQRQNNLDRNKDDLDTEMNHFSNAIKRNPYFSNDYLSRKGHISSRNSLIKKYKHQINRGNNKPTTDIYPSETPKEIIKDLNHPDYYDKFFNVIEHPKKRQYYLNNPPRDYFEANITFASTNVRAFVHHTQKLAHHPNRKMKQVYYDHQHGINPIRHRIQNKQKKSVKQMLNSIMKQQKSLNKEKHIFSKLQKKVSKNDTLQPQKSVKKHKNLSNKNIKRIRDRKQGLSR